MGWWWLALFAVGEASIGKNLNVLYMAADHHAYIAVHQFSSV